MTEYLKIEEMVFQRDENSELLPVDLILFPLEKKKYESVKDNNGKITGKKAIIYEPAPKIKVIPPSRGKWLSILKMEPERQEHEILFNHVFEPKIDEKVYSCLKSSYVDAIIKAFTYLALDLNPDDIKNKTKEKLTEAEEFQIQKN